MRADLRIEFVGQWKKHGARWSNQIETKHRHVAEFHLR